MSVSQIRSKLPILLGAAIIAGALAVNSVGVAEADTVGTSGPYSVVVKPAIQYAWPAEDVLIECKPVRRVGQFGGPFPAMMLIHGGGWSGGSPMIGPNASYSPRWCTLWASWGFDTFSVGYRLTRHTPWPAQIVDVQAAIRYVRANAGALGVNAALIGVNGDSSGGQMALIAGYIEGKMPGDLTSNNADVNSQPQLVINQFGPWNWGPWRGPNDPSVQANDYATKVLRDAAAGLTRSTTPNTLFVQGSTDTLVAPCSQSAAGTKLLRSFRRPVSYLAFAGGHEFTNIQPSVWGKVVGLVQTRTIAFAYAQAHFMGVIPSWQHGPELGFSDALPGNCR